MNPKVKQIQSKHAKYKTNNFISNYLVRNFFKKINRLVGEIEFSSVLDIGCGEGMLFLNIAKYINNKKCCAIDFDIDEIKDAFKNLPFCEVKFGTVYQIPYENREFELVTCTEVLEHLKEPAKALEEICRVTNKYVLLSVPREPLWRLLNIARLSYLKEFGNTPGHVNHWSCRQFIKFVENYFEVIDVSKPIPWSILIAKRR
ncbi:MAG: class I SAM-dependent methyltransferase [Bacteroidales bacterium]|jgi:ubiquinone/menaquinone biosynthesis C-methylase UbiE